MDRINLQITGATRPKIITSSSIKTPRILNRESYMKVMNQFQRPSHSNTLKLVLIVVFLFSLLASISTVLVWVYLHGQNNQRMVICECQPLSTTVTPTTESLLDEEKLTVTSEPSSSSYATGSVDNFEVTTAFINSNITDLESLEVNEIVTTTTTTDSYDVPNETTTPVPSTFTTIPSTTTTEPDPDPLSTDRRNFIKKMAREQFANYRKYAWGADQHAPLTQTPVKDVFGNATGNTIVSSLSTLWVMGLMDEFDAAKSWVQKELHFGDIDEYIDVQKALFDYVAGLSSAYALSKEKMFLDRAVEIANILEPAYHTPLGLPREELRPKYRQLNSNNPISYIFGITSPLLEYGYLSSILINETTFANRTQNIISFLQRITKPHHGLYKDRVNITSGQWVDPSLEIGPNKQVYSHMIKGYILSNRQEVELLKLFKDAIESLERNGMFEVDPDTGLAYAWNNELSNDDEDYESMTYEGYALGATLALAASEMQKALDKKSDQMEKNTKRKELYRIYRLWELAEQLTETCYQVSKRTKTGLPPSKVTFMNDEYDSTEYDPNVIKGLQVGTDEAYLLSPQLAESYFTLWRLTHDPKYREYAWQLAQSIHAHARTEDGSYAIVENVNQVPAVKDNSTSVYFLSGTLKFLYLTFCDDTVLPLDRWVFTEVGHPLPISDSGREG